MSHFIDITQHPKLLHFFTHVSDECPIDFMHRYVALETRLRLDIASPTKHPLTSSLVQEFSNLASNIDSKLERMIPVEFNAAKSMLSQAFDKWTQNLTDNQMSVQSILTKSLLRHENVKTKGDDYEKDFMGLLSTSEELNAFEIVNSTKIGHCGDFVLRHQETNQDIVVDVKCWSTKINKDNIDKFRGDCQRTTCIGGILISQSTPITGKMTFDIEQVSGKVMFFIGCNKDCIREVVACAKAIVYIASLNAPKEEKTQKYEDDKVQKLLASLKDVITGRNEALVGLSMAYNALNKTAWSSLDNLIKTLEPDVVQPEKHVNLIAHKKATCQGCGREFKSLKNHKCK